jgi:hypothetical protein
MELTFLGTRGEIKARSRRHRRHSALLVRCGRARIMIDCGADWLNAVNSVSPTAILLTHAHGDHAFGLAKGVSCPVYATDDTWSAISRFPIADRHTSRLQAAECVSKRFRSGTRSGLRRWVIASWPTAQCSSMSPTWPRLATGERRSAGSRSTSATGPRSPDRWSDAVTMC